MVTIQGEMVVPKFLPRKGPRGTYSHLWMSRADQSFSSTAPKMWSQALDIGIVSPSCEPGPTKNPISNSKSRSLHGAKEGGGAGGEGSSFNFDCPQGLRMGVPETTTEEERP